MDQGVNILGKGVACSVVVSATLDFWAIGIRWVVVIAADGIGAESPVVDAKLPAKQSTGA